MDFKRQMHSNGRFFFGDWHNVEAFVLSPQWHGDFLLRFPECCAPYECCRSLSMTLPPVLAYHPSVILDNKVGASSLWHLGITKYYVLTVMHFVVVSLDSAACYHCADSCLPLSSRSVIFLLQTRLQTRIHDSRLCYLLDGSQFYYALAYATSQRSTEVDWTPSDIDESWLLYTFDFGLVQGVSIG